jgi:hypothetical protein
LSSFRRHVHGPILLSFSKPLDTPSQNRSAVKKWLKRDPNDFFSVYSGFTHAVRVAELEAAARQSGLKIIHLNEGRTVDALSPHVVLVPVDFAQLSEFAGEPSCRGEARQLLTKLEGGVSTKATESFL